MLSIDDLISVEDRLPENNEDVLVIGLFRPLFEEWHPVFTTGFYNSQNGKWTTERCYSNQGYFCCVLYWAPLPPMPDIDISIGREDEIARDKKSALNRCRTP